MDLSFLTVQAFHSGLRTGKNVHNIRRIGINFFLQPECQSACYKYVLVVFYCLLHRFFVGNASAFKSIFTERNEATIRNLRDFYGMCRRSPNAQ